MSAVSGRFRLSRAYAVWPGAFRGLLGSFWAVCLTLVGELEADLVGARRASANSGRLRRAGTHHVPHKGHAIVAGQASETAPRCHQTCSQTHPAGLLATVQHDACCPLFTATERRQRDKAPAGALQEELSAPFPDEYRDELRCCFGWIARGRASAGARWRYGASAGWSTLPLACGYWRATATS